MLTKWSVSCLSLGKNEMRLDSVFSRNPLVVKVYIHSHTLLLLFELLYLAQFLAFFILQVIFIHTCLPSIGYQCCTEQASLDVVGFP
jgi:hypothetical protein